MLNKSTLLLSKKENQWWTHTAVWTNLDFETPSGSKGVSQDTGGVYPSEYVTFYDNSGEALPLVPITVFATPDYHRDGGHGKLVFLNDTNEWSYKAITIYVSPDGRGYTTWSPSDYEPADGDQGPMLTVDDLPYIDSFFPFEVTDNGYSLGELLIPETHYYISQTRPPWLVEVKFLVTIDGVVAANKPGRVDVHKWSTAPEDGSDTYSYRYSTDSNGVLTLYIPPMDYTPDSTGCVWGWSAEVYGSNEGAGTGTYTKWDPEAGEVLPMELHT